MHFAALGKADVGANDGVTDLYPRRDVDRRHDHDIFPIFVGGRCAARFQHVAIGLQKRIRGATILPNVDRACLELFTRLDHQLERIGQEIFPLRLNIFGHQPLDGGEKGGVIFQIIDADHRLIGNEVFGLLDETLNQILSVGYHHAETARVFNLAGVDHPVMHDLWQGRQIGIRNRVGEDDQHRLIHQLARQPDGVGLPLAVDLLHVVDGKFRVMLRDVGLNLFTEITDDEGNFRHVRLLQLFKDMAQNGVARHLHQWLRLAVGVRAQPCAVSRHRYDDMHG